MKLARGDVEIDGDERGAVLSNFFARQEFRLDGEALRWLILVAGPAVLSDPAPAEPKTDAPENPEQIPGQTTIDEVLVEGQAA